MLTRVHAEMWSRPKTLCKLNGGEFADRGPSQHAINLAGFLALVGVAMGIYLRVS